MGAAAATADPVAAGAGMLGFVLGTLPMLVAIGLLPGHGAAAHWRDLARKAMPVIAAVNAVVLLTMAWRIAHKSPEFINIHKRLRGIAIPRGFAHSADNSRILNGVNPSRTR